MDLSTEREKLVETVEQKEENQHDSCLSLESRKNEQSGKQVTLRKRRVKKPIENIDIRKESQTSLSKDLTDSAERKESGVSNDTSNTTREIDELSTDDDPMDQSTESLNVLFSVMMAPSIAKESLVWIVIHMIY